MHNTTHSHYLCLLCNAQHARHHGTASASAADGGRHTVGHSQAACARTASRTAGGDLDCVAHVGALGPFSPRVLLQLEESGADVKKSEPEPEQPKKPQKIWSPFAPPSMADTEPEAEAAPAAATTAAAAATAAAETVPSDMAKVNTSKEKRTPKEFVSSEILRKIFLSIWGQNFKDIFRLRSPLDRVPQLLLV